MKVLEVEAKLTEATVEAENSVETLIARLKTGSDWARFRAAEELGIAQDPQAVPALIEAFQDRNRDVRVNAVQAIQEIGDHQAVPALIEALQHTDRSVRSTAAKALGVIKDPRAFSPLNAVLETGNRDEDWMVHYNAAEALGEIGDPRAVPALSKCFKHKSKDKYGDQSIHDLGVRVLGSLGSPQAIVTLGEVVKDKSIDERIRHRAAHRLMESGDPQVVLGLIEALDGENTHWLAHREVIKVSVRLGLSAVPALIASLRHPALAQEAASVLREITQQHPDPVLRTALPALRRLRGRNPVFREAWEQIERVTSAFKNLPLSASAPPLDADTLPRPVADMPSDASVPASPGRWLRLRRRLRW